QIAHRANVGIAGIGAADARGVRDHGLQLGAYFGFGIAEENAVAVGLRHLAAVGAGKLGGGREQRLGLGEDVVAVRIGGGGADFARVELVETAGDFAADFEVRDLVFADRDVLRLVDEDVGGHENGVAEESKRAEVLVVNVLALLFVGGDAF